MSHEDQSPHRTKGAKFDAYAKDYEALHGHSIRASGEQPGYFADYKVDCIARVVGPGYDEPVLDYGCGVGLLTARLIAQFPRVSAFDPSATSLVEARSRAASATFYESREALPRAHFGVIVVANVLHHVPPVERVPLLAGLSQFLQPGRGMLMVFEHNPYNPLTRRAVATCAFDDDAVLVGPRELTRLLTKAGLVGARRTFIVFFPRMLAGLRGLEPHLGWLPIGAQVMAQATAPARRE